MVQLDEKTAPVGQSGGEKQVGADAGEIRTRPDDAAMSGESGGGAYPNPHNSPGDKEDETTQYPGGQSGGAGYFGHGQLGPKRLSENENAVSERGD